jgi:hypothetical protein
VTSFEAYAAYQQQRGSNTAWTWEHQAMTRARFVRRPAPCRRALMRCAGRDHRAARPKRLRAEIVAMRERCAPPTRCAAGSFDVKHSPGGMVDVPSLPCSTWCCRTAATRNCCDNVGNIALLQRAEALGLLPAGVGHARPTPTASCAACSTAHGWTSSPLPLAHLAGALAGTLAGLLAALLLRRAGRVPRVKRVQDLRR